MSDYSDDDSGVIPDPASPARTRTRFQASKLCHLWEICNYSLCSKEKGKRIESSVFSSSKNWADKNKWRLELYLYPDEHFRVFNDFALHLRLVSSSASQVSIKYQMSIKNSDGLWLPSGIETEIVKVGGAAIKNESFIAGKQLETNKFHLVPGDTLTLLCEIHTTTESTEEFDSEYVSNCTIRKDLGALLEKQELCDVTIVAADGKEYRAHKAILGARSSVFAAMFKNDMVEKNQNKVEIADMKHDVIFQFLRFVYTGKVNTSNMLAELLAASDKYDLQGLKEICKKTLGKSLTFQTAANTLLLADTYFFKDLKKKVVDFILDHSEEVKKTDCWITLTKNHPQLVMEAVLFKERTRKD